MPYFGGKSQSGSYQKIINQIPPHRVYIEPFAGGGAVLLKKRPALVNIVLDVDSRAIVDLAENVGASCTPGYTFICGDAISFLGSYDFKGDEFVYLDPPYLFETRKSKTRYVYEFGDVEQHEALLSLLLRLPCKVAISGYLSSLYSSMLATWRVISWRVLTRGHTWATEYLWMNYSEPAQLHDYRYLGDNYREREKLAKMRRRWLARLERMPVIERYMLLSALESLSSKPAESGGTAGD